MINIKEGHYFDMTNEEYHACRNSISKSGLMEIKKSPRHYYESYILKKEEKSSESMDLGTLLHCLVLENDQFGNRYLVWEGLKRNTKEGKESYALHLKDCLESGKKSITNEQYESAMSMYNSINRNTMASDLIKGGLMSLPYFLKILIMMLCVDAGLMFCMMNTL